MASSRSLEDLDRLFDDPANRALGVFYRCSADPRVIAPSGPDWRGWQINWAHPRAFRVLLLYLGILLGPIALVGTLGPRDTTLLVFLALGTFAISVIVLIGLCVRLSRRPAAFDEGDGAGSG